MASAVHALRPNSGEQALNVALQRDWDAGRPEDVRPDEDGRYGSIQTGDGFIGYVACQDYKGRDYLAFRSIPKTAGSIWRLVVAIDTDGKPQYVGRIRRSR
jgi:hypothetical protein